MRLHNWHKPLAVVVIALIAMGYLVSQTAVAKDKSPNAQTRNKNRATAKNVSRPGLNQLAKATPRHEIPSLDLSTGEKVKSSVTKTPIKQVRKISRKIDELVDAKLTAAGIEPAPLANDEVFLRRAYLDIIGRIPTLAETNAFLDSKQKQKRSLLIDELLDSYGYVSRQFNFWADVLRAKTDLRNIAGQPYIDFIKDSLSENKPYDDFVREMLTASGPNLRRGNGAVGYYLRDSNMQEDNMSNTVRIFLGTRLECAQCHDHPFDIWTQRDYFEMVAYTGGISFRSQPIDSEHRADLMRLRNDKTLERDERAAIRKMIEPMTYGIAGEGNGLARLPEDYDAGDGEPHEIVTSKTMFDKEPLIDVKVPVPNKRRLRNAKRINAKFPQRIHNAPEVGSREAYANWMTAPENPRFSTVIVNRLWKQVMGLGIVEPLDTFSDDTVASNRPLLDYLGETMIDLDFDMKQVLRAIYNSNTYQRVADAREIPEPKKHCFNGPLVRRMKAEQIWDSLLCLVTTDIDNRQRGSGGRGMRYFPGLDIYDGYEALRELDVDQIRTLADAYMQRSQNGGKRAMAEAMTEVFGDEYQAKARKDGKRSGKYDVDMTGPQIGMEMAKLSKQLQAAKADRDRRAMQRLAKERQELVTFVREVKRKGNFLRASELPSPAKPGHFLREFGQSDRDQIENANQEPAVTQSLSLMNGLIERTISRYHQSTLMKNIQSTDAPKDQVRVAYLTMLNRQPRLEESELWASAIEDDGRTGISDMIWTLANSVEFLFVK